MGGGTAGPDLPDRVRVTGAQPGIASDPATRPRGVQPGFRPLGDERPFELRDGCRSPFRASVCPFGVQWIPHLLADMPRSAVSYAALMRVICSGRPPLSGW